MYQPDNSNYRTNESMSKAFMNSCLGRIIILTVFTLILLLFAYLSTPTKKEMLIEMDDNILQCIEANSNLKGDPVDDYVNNLSSIVTYADTTKITEDRMKAYRMYNKLEAYRHTFYATTHIVNNMHPEGVRVGIGIFGMVIPTVTFKDILLDVGPVHKGYNQTIIKSAVPDTDLGVSPNIQEFHYQRNPDN